MQKSIGQPLDRVDGPLKVTGQATYTADQQYPERGPRGPGHEHHRQRAASCRSIRSAAERAARRAARCSRTQTRRSWRLTQQELQPAVAGRPRKLQLLQDDRILYGNQPIAVAVAETLEAALRSRTSGQSALRGGSAIGTSGRMACRAPTRRRRRAAAGDPGESSRGDIDAGLRAGRHVQVRA